MKANKKKKFDQLIYTRSKVLHTINFHREGIYKSNRQVSKETDFPGVLSRRM